MASVNLQLPIQRDSTGGRHKKAPVNQHAGLPKQEAAVGQEPVQVQQTQPRREYDSEGEDDPFTSPSEGSLNQLTEEKPEVILHELNFLSLPSQSNVYGMVNIHYKGSNKLLVATLRGEIFKLEFEKRSLRPSLKPVTFSYIPGTARVLCMCGLATGDLCRMLESADEDRVKPVFSK